MANHSNADLKYNLHTMNTCSDLVWNSEMTFNVKINTYHINTFGEITDRPIHFDPYISDSKVLNSANIDFIDDTL